MKRTVSLKLNVALPRLESLAQTEQVFADVCNVIAEYARENRCWNQVQLHHLCYYAVRERIPEVGSQMVCNAIRKVCSAYKVLKIKKSEDVPQIKFRVGGSIRYCARTFTMKDETLSLYTVKGRVSCTFQKGDFQDQYLQKGKVREAELIRKKEHWYFNLVLELPDVSPSGEGAMMAVDIGENNLATTSNGTIFGGCELRHERDRFLARRAKLQSNGSRSAKRRLCRISGKERRRVQQTNHRVSKAIVEEAIRMKAGIVVLEDLTNIRKRIRAGKRMRSRLHRWAWRQLQEYIGYKAQAAGIEVIYVNPAYSSQICSKCGDCGSRNKHRFKCNSCGSLQHSDCNAAINLLRLGESAVSSRVSVNAPKVAI